MQGLSNNARKVLKRPGAFAFAVIKHFRANQGLLLAGAVAYYTLLSLIPLLILSYSQILVTEGIRRQRLELAI